MNTISDSHPADNQPADHEGSLLAPVEYMVVHPTYRRSRLNWSGVFFVTLVAILLGVAGWIVLHLRSVRPPTSSQTRFITPAPPTATLMPLPTPTLAPTALRQVLTFMEPTSTPTPVPGGRLLTLSAAAEDAGWVVSEDESMKTIYDEPNHFGDSFLYAGSLDGKIYSAAFQFNLSRVLRGTKIYAASLRLTGLRADLLDKTGGGAWRLQMLAPEITAAWQTVNYQQLYEVKTWTAFEPVLTPANLAEEQVNVFEFNAGQVALLERYLLEGNTRLAFRLDGPEQSGRNLFGWDSGYGQASRRQGPALLLSLGPPPKATPAVHYVIVTSTPTPENIITAVANLVRMTAEATRAGTATSLPSNWVTPFVVTATPTARNEATAQLLYAIATATALAGGLPPNVVTASPTPTYVLITSTPTAEDVLTAMAISVELTAQAARNGTPTPFPPNWVTPLVVTVTPTPASSATAAYLQAVEFTTGTPTPMPTNVQTATPTPVFVTVEPLASATTTATPTPTYQPMPEPLLGKILFLTDREGSTEEELLRAARLKATPWAEPQAYVFDPATGQLGELTDMWPYQAAAARDAWSADKVYEAYTQALLWTNVEESGFRRQTTVLAIHYYDYLYNVERQVTRMGAGIVYDPVWSPVSDEIAFVATESGNDEIWVIHHDGTDVRQLTRNQWEWDKHPSWSPDGQSIVFYTNRSGNNQLWIMNADGADQHPLMTWNPYNDWDPIWVKYRDPPPSLERKVDWRFVKPPEEQQLNK